MHTYVSNVLLVLTIICIGLVQKLFQLSCLNRAFRVSFSVSGLVLEVRGTSSGNLEGEDPPPTSHHLSYCSGKPGTLPIPASPPTRPADQTKNTPAPL
ncbi:hypothetical protein CEXT_561461 [Caerostris extrusa]|uniref:Uncharacterized protein n=1 Tax=Caerostris extrusa TaxID=172846 RepID=A0AAV4SEQ1_CAEEX|nr:hypothetical protein CEXT_561461 [Caerostris extrusa]